MYRYDINILYIYIYYYFLFHLFIYSLSSCKFMRDDILSFHVGFLLTPTLQSASWLHVKCGHDRAGIINHTKLKKAVLCTLSFCVRNLRQQSVLRKQKYINAGQMLRVSFGNLQNLRCQKDQMLVPLKLSDRSCSASSTASSCQARDAAPSICRSAPTVP